MVYILNKNEYKNTKNKKFSIFKIQRKNKHLYKNEKNRGLLRPCSSKMEYTVQPRIYFYTKFDKIDFSQHH